MNNNEFDKLLKDKLSNIDNANSPSDWDEFSKILSNAEGFQDVNFDSNIKKQLSNHTHAFNPNHWESLKERLEKEELIRNKLYKVKAIELLAILLLIIGVNHFQNKKFQSLPIVFLPQNQKVIDKNLSPALNNHYEIKTDQVRVSQLDQNYFEAIKKLKEQKLVKQLDLVNANTNSIQSADLSSKEWKDDFSEAYKNDKLELTPSLSHKPLIKLTSFTPQSPHINQELSYKFPPLKSVAQKSISPIISAGIGITQSPFDPIYKINSYKTYGSQFGIGLLYGVKKGRLEFQTGLKYNKRFTHPAQFYETYGAANNKFYEIGLHQISYDMVEIPIGFKYHYIDRKSTSAYAKLSVNGIATLYNNYTLIDKPKGTYINSLNEAKYSSDESTLDRKASRTKLSNKSFPNGLFEGGNLKDNSFMTVSLELGIENKISKRDALTLGLEYSKYYMIDGVGPNNDKLNGITINLGLKHTIN